MEHQTAAPPSADASDESPEPAQADDRRRVEALEDQLRRTLADLDNLRKRFNREIARERADERARVAALWVPIVDDLERALQHADGDDTPIVAGVRAVRDHALTVLAGLGYPRYEDVGEPFDPSRHEALGTIESAAPPGTIVAVARPGYGTTETVLRPAGVLVARGSS
jgi:molecular chaperone GrpE